MAVRIVCFLPEVVGWSKNSLWYTRGSWMAVRIVLVLPEVVGWK